MDAIKSSGLSSLNKDDKVEFRIEVRDTRDVAVDIKVLEAARPGSTSGGRASS
eukprot:SAG31_NODE_45745_length_257_cov_0.987342_1_plen_52_part_10